VGSDDNAAVAVMKKRRCTGVGYVVTESIRSVMGRQQRNKHDTDELAQLAVETALHTLLEGHDRIDVNAIDVFVRQRVTRRLMLFFRSDNDDCYW